MLITPVALWLSTEGNPLDYMHYDLPPGQLLYVFSKLMGLYTVMFLWLQIMYGLVGKGNWVDALLPKWSIPTHRLIGILVMSAALTHFALFFSAVALRKQTIPVHLLVPDFSSYFHAVVTLGVISLYLMILVVLVGIYRSRLGKYWVWSHRLSVLMIIVVIAHSLLIGSETKSVTWLTFYAVAGTTLIAAIYRRIATTI